MPIDWSQYSLDQLKGHAIETFREGGGSRPDVILIEIEGERAVLKDQGGADALFASLIGPILNWRECKALRKLDSISCIPNLLHVPSKRAFLMTYHQSEQITQLIRHDEANIHFEWPVFFDQLNDAIAQIHAAGVAHNDLRNPSNTLVTPSGQPVLVDLVACFCRGEKWNIINRWLFQKFCQVDRSAVTKIKSRVAPELITEADIQPEDIAGRAGIAAKELGQWIRRLSRRLFTK